MTKRRRTANPIFQQPLTADEQEGKRITKAMSRYLTCRLCNSTGGTLVKVPDTAPTEYECQDRGKCKIMRQRR